METVYSNIPLEMMRFYAYKSHSKKKSAIGEQMALNDAISKELEPLCAFIQKNAQEHLNDFYKHSTPIKRYKGGASVSHGYTCSGAATIYDKTFAPKALASWAFYARKIAFFTYYNNYLRHIAENYCKSGDFDYNKINFAQTNQHVINTTETSLDRKVFDSIMHAKHCSNAPKLTKVVIPFSDMDDYSCLSKHFHYNKENGILRCHFRSFTGGIIIDFRLPAYFRDSVNKILNDPTKYIVKDQILTKPTLIYDSSQSDPKKRFRWNTTIAYTYQQPEKVNDDLVLAIDLGEKNHARMCIVGKDGSYSNMITPGREHAQLMRKIERIDSKIRNNKRIIKLARKSIKTIKKRNPNSKRIQQIQDNEIVPLVLENNRCRAKIARIRKHLSWILARDVCIICQHMNITKIVTEDLTFANKDHWHKGRDIQCIQWTCAKMGIKVIIKSIYYASHTCPFCWSYLEPDWIKRISTCNGIPVPQNKAHIKVHPPTKDPDIVCNWVGDRDYTAGLYMGSKYFKQRLMIEKNFTIGATPLRITQRAA